MEAIISWIKHYIWVRRKRYSFVLKFIHKTFLFLFSLFLPVFGPFLTWVQAPQSWSKPGVCWNQWGLWEGEAEMGACSLASAPCGICQALNKVKHFALSSVSSLDLCARHSSFHLLLARRSPETPTCSRATHASVGLDVRCCTCWSLFLKLKFQLRKMKGGMELGWEDTSSSTHTAFSST